MLGKPAASETRSRPRQGADPEDPDEYRAQNVFWVPPEARWAHLRAQARQPTISRLIDDAMAGIERELILAGTSDGRSRAQARGGSSS